MLEELISRKISSLIDWSTSFISGKYPAHEEDSYQITLFKHILMTVDSVYFMPLLSEPTSIRELEIAIIQYFKEKYEQTKETVLQGGTGENTPLRVLSIFQLILELAYVSSKQQCLTALYSLSNQCKETINKILEGIMDQRGKTIHDTPLPHSSESETIKRLKEENKRLRVTIQGLRVKESELIRANEEMEYRIRSLEYQNLRKDSEVEMSNKKILELETIIKEISIEIFNEENQEDPKSYTYQNQNRIQLEKQLSQPLVEYVQDSSERVLTGIAEKSFEEGVKPPEDQYLKRLEKQCRKSQQINHRFQLLRSMHQKLQNEVENILITDH